MGILVILVLTVVPIALYWPERGDERKRAVYVTKSSDPIFGRKAWSHRYDDLDRMAGRPIHRGMSVAPPWAKRLRRRNRHDHPNGSAA
ncbi:hypothetical protein [Microbacterium sp. VKM Ac-2923]|uniref:hypothetical protein n=1 Tax=Microbacterium sp. VKM Ac-2923 TaxID=2929476 RepID=UPI001FB2F0D1|nr:hypothetical protein [Microbacterium sp. VKM Ac-2923]MCJ1709260.1 hypothetical protein [Microbacterium sp. VKM Ac-2923]